MEAFIKLYKKLLDWEWYHDPNTCRVFIHCLLKANWKPTRWHNIDLKPGQFVTSLQKLADETCLSKHQVRTALEHLKMTQEVALTRHSKCSVVTVNNWNLYQGSGTQTARKVATDKEYKNKRIKDNNVSVPKSKISTFNNFNQRKYDMDELMKNME